jgi:hypothetical protein
MTYLIYVASTVPLYCIIRVQNDELSWVYLTANGQSTSSSWYRAPLWGPWPDFILLLSLWQLLCCSSCRASYLTRGRVCNLQCNRWLVRSPRTNNHTLPSHLGLCSLFVASYDSQGLRCRYFNSPPHEEEWYLSTISYRNSVCTSQESHDVILTRPHTGKSEIFLLVSYIGIQFVPHRNHITSF